MLLPVVHLVIADQDLREPRAVRLDASVPFVTIHRSRTAEDQAAGAGGQHRRAHVTPARIDRDSLARNTGLEEGLGHAVRRPRLLRSWLEHEAELEWNYRQPQRVHPGSVRGQHQTEHRSLSLITHGHPSLDAVSAREHVKVQAPRQRCQDGPHLPQHERVLLHVRAAHVLRHAGTGRLRLDELLWRLAAIANRQRRVHVEFACLGRHGNEFVYRELTKRFSGLWGLAHVALHEPTVGAAHACDRLTRREVSDVVMVHAGIRLAPAQHRDVKHRVP